MPQPETAFSDIVTCFRLETGDNIAFEPLFDGRITREEMIDTAFSHPLQESSEKYL